MIEDTSVPEETNLISIRKIIDRISEKYDKIWVKRKRSINSKFLIRGSCQQLPKRLILEDCLNFL